jgi:hypothetical protein
VSRPRYSLVVPTRNRAHTLRFYLQTCLAQEIDDFEVVVSDNASPPETREVALSFGDPRIRYLRTPQDLSLTDSLEFALAQASGEYVTMLGDDDGYLLHALKQVDLILRLAPIEALRWDAVLYNWPDVAPQSYAAPNTLVLPLHQGRAGHVLQRKDPRAMIQAAANAAVAYSDLPSVYSGLVRRDVLERVRARGGRVFRSRTADVYAAFAIAAVVDSYWSLDAPMTIAGVSGRSTGISRHFARRGSEIDEQFRRSSDAAGHTWHATVPDLPPIAASVADSFLYAMEAFPEIGATLDRRRVVDAVLRDLYVADDAEWREALAACRRALSDDPALLAWFEDAHAARPMPPDQTTPRRQAARRYAGSYLALDATEHGVTDVMGAARLCERLLGYRKDGIHFQLREALADGGESLSELQEKERQIQAMTRAIERLDAELQRLKARRLKNRIRRLLGLRR